MNEHDIVITDADRRRLRSLVKRLRDAGHVRNDHVAALAERIRRAGVVSPKDVPRNVVTLNSQVSLRDLDSGSRVHCTLSDPFEIGVFGSRLSVAALRERSCWASGSVKSSDGPAARGSAATASSKSPTSRKRPATFTCKRSNRTRCRGGLKGVSR
jgi:hypothetical protein